MLMRRTDLHLTKQFACIILLVQAAFLPSSISAHRSAVDVPEKGTATLNLLHKGGSPNRLKFEDDLGLILFEVFVNERSVWAILDNGAGNTIMDTSLALQMGLPVEREAGTITTTHGQAEKATISNVHLTVPGQFRIRGDFVGANLRAISGVTDKDIGLILGSDILKHLAYLIDTKNKRLIFVLSGGMKPKIPNTQVIPIVDGVISGTLNGSPANFQIDLGSNSKLLVLTESWGNFFAESSAPPATSRSIDLSGKVVEKNVKSNVSISFAGIHATVDAHEISFKRKGVDGFIGYPVLKGKTLIFDYKDEKLLIVK